MTLQVPKFTVIGRVNKGKSSIVSTLSEDDSVVIDERPGSTKFCLEFPFRVDGKTLMILIDTPGFQHATRALAWLRRKETSVSNRRDVIEKFVQKFEKKKDFIDECRLLKPILAGSGILYVVDGAKPFRKNYEAEMEILRWTGQPRMALINKIGEGDFSDEWRPALDQYFSVVRDFNANQVRFLDRIRLLEAFRELHEPWREMITVSINLLKSDWQRRQREAAKIIAKLIIDELTYEQEITLDKKENPEDHKIKIQNQFHDYLRNRERKARRSVESLYKHRKVQTVENELSQPVFEQDLFAKTTWNILGLSPKQIIGLGAVAGATVGGFVDAGVGGASFMTGTLIGGSIGAASAFYFSARRFVSIDSIIDMWRGNKIIKIGPHKNPNFPWILLDRALLHYKNIHDFAHSRREKIILQSRGNDQRLVKNLNSIQRKELNRLFVVIRKKRNRDNARLQVELEKMLVDIIQVLT